MSDPDRMAMLSKSSKEGRKGSTSACSVRLPRSVWGSATIGGGAECSR